MDTELLLPDTISPQIQERLGQLKLTLKRLKEMQKDMPEGHLRIAQKGSKRPLFYHYTSPKDINGKYIRKKEKDFARVLAQKDYNERLILQLEKEISSLQEYLSQSQKGRALSQIYETLCPARQELITPAILTDEQYVEQWKSLSWKGLPFDPEAPAFDTAKGDIVRSKSEVIIADTLYRHGIPYRYEYPITLKQKNSNITLHPDFLCLNVRTRQEFIWEHFGLMDDPDYVKIAGAKLRLYSENEIFSCNKFIFTMESQKAPLSTRDIENKIEQFLK